MADLIKKLNKTFNIKITEVYTTEGRIAEDLSELFEDDQITGLYYLNSEAYYFFEIDRSFVSFLVS